MRRITYLTGTRADFGVMVPILRSIAEAPGLELDLVVTGMHLSGRFGRTEQDVEASGLPIAARIPVDIDDDSGRGMAVSVAQVAKGMAEHLAANRCDTLLVLGDRGEMLAAAMAALFEGIPIAHLCGGERSGSVDESIRHAISKLAHVHLVAAEDGEHRLIAMGEEPWRVHRVGAPGLVGLIDMAVVPVAELAERYGFDSRRSYALMLFHPVVQEAAQAGRQVALLLDRLTARDMQIVCLLPNADHGNSLIRAQIMAAAEGGKVTPVDHMPRGDYVSALRNAALLIGNSSSGIVEAASLGTAVVNLGDRQKGRLRSANTFDTPFEAVSIDAAIDAALAFDADGLVNVYGDSETGSRVAQILNAIDLRDSSLLKKMMTY